VARNGVSLGEAERTQLRAVRAKGVAVFIQMVPGDAKEPLEQILEEREREK
jgi:mannose/fructose/N-acetylgalactosamine-specific phosphotransferase system component IIB